MKKKKKKQLSQLQVYKKELKKSEVLKKLAPVVFFTFILLALFFVYLTLKNSIGNIKEILYMLDKKIFNGEQIEQNYLYLIEKYGEWEIIGGKAGKFSIRFIDIKKAIFGSVMTVYFILCIVCFVIAIGIGHILFPMLSKYYEKSSKYIVDVATLETAEAIKEEKQKKKNSEEEWF